MDKSIKEIGKAEPLTSQYIIIFSSYYKAAYGFDILSSVGIDSSLERAPSGYSKSCSYGLYLRYPKDKREYLKGLLDYYNVPFNNIIEKKA